MSESTYRTQNFYLSAYIMTTMDVEPVLEGRNFVFPDPTGEIAWSAEAFYQDKTVGKFCSSLKKLRNMRTPRGSLGRTTTPSAEFAH